MDRKRTIFIAAVALLMLVPYFTDAQVVRVLFEEMAHKDPDWA